MMLMSWGGETAADADMDTAELEAQMRRSSWAVWAAGAGAIPTCCGTWNAGVSMTLTKPFSGQRPNIGRSLRSGGRGNIVWIGSRVVLGSVACSTIVHSHVSYASQKASVSVTYKSHNWLAIATLFMQPSSRDQRVIKTNPRGNNLQTI